MTINNNLLVSAPMLQDYLVTKDSGLPLSNGIISLYKDTSRSFYKNWYYQTGIPGAYTWVALDNPLHLSSAGTIQDPNGNDVIPFYYPFDETDELKQEAYYITVYSVDSNGNPAVLQFTRENFPFQPSNSSPTEVNPTLRNYILNNIYWRNIGFLDCMNVTDQVIVPSQHEGYTNGDIRFIKNVTGADDDLIFSPMTSTLINNITPEYYLNFTCAGTQAGETVKCIQYPISLHVKTLQNVFASIVIEAQNVDGGANNYLDVYVYQYTGTGALSPSTLKPWGDNNGRITLNGNFNKFILTDIFPSAAGLALGSGNDDALFLRIQYPRSLTCNINHTKPQIFLSKNIPSNDFDTYDQVSSIINSPRTGDFRTSINDFIFGWVVMDNQTIGNSSSTARNRANSDTWPLFNFIWQKMKIYSNGSSNQLAQMYTDADIPVAYGSTAIEDFNANRQITLTQALGYVISGCAPTRTNTTFTANGTSTLTLGTTPSFPNVFTGMPIVFSNTGGALPVELSSHVVYFYISVSPTTFRIASSYANALVGTDIGSVTAGSGTNTITFSPLGASVGENFHTLRVNELATHSHGTGGASAFVVTAGTGPNYLNAGPTAGAANNDTGTTGSNDPHNTMQPTVFYNVFLKL